MEQVSHRLADTAAPAVAALAAQNPVVLLPLGSQETHGPDWPMGDFMLADILAGQITQACAAAGVPVLLAPTLPYGVADYFASSPGSMALSPASFRQVLVDLLSGLLAQGLHRVVILNGHGGNVPIIHEVTLGLKKTHNTIIPSLYLWKLARALMERNLGPASAPRFGHGAEPLASLNLALRPGLHTRLSPPPAQSPAQPPAFALGLPVNGFGSVEFEGLAVEIPSEFHQVPQTAINHARALANAATGAQTAAALVAYATSFITHFSKFTAVS